MSSNSLLYSPSSLLAIASVQVPAAGLSLIASSAVAAMVGRSRNGGLRTPYRRIIFGLCIADILQSIALLTGPWMLPSWAMIPGLWGSPPPLEKEDNFTQNDAEESGILCQLNGSLIHCGTLSVPMYTCLLCVYYLCKLKYRITNEVFHNRFEKKGHILIVTVNLAVLVAQLALDTIHPYVDGLICMTTCSIMPDVVGECEPKLEARTKLLLALQTLVSSIAMISMVIIMMKIYLHSKDWNRRHVSHPGNKDLTPKSAPTNNASAEDIIALPNTLSNQQGTTEETEHDISRENFERLARLYKGEVAIQAGLYVGMFFLHYLPLIVLGIIVDFHPTPPAMPVYILATCIYPIGGVSNILIHTRPQVVTLRRRNPNMSRIRCFWIVLRNGGEAPVGLSDENRVIVDLDSPISLPVEQTTSSALFGIVPPNSEPAVYHNSNDADDGLTSYRNSNDADDGLSISFGPSRVEYRSSSLWNYASNRSNTNVTGSDDENKSVSDPAEKHQNSTEVLTADTSNRKVGGASKEEDCVESIAKAGMERARRMQHVLSSNMHSDKNAS